MQNVLRLEGIIDDKKIFLCGIVVFGLMSFSSCSKKIKMDYTDPQFLVEMERFLGFSFPESIEWIGCEGSYPSAQYAPDSNPNGFNVLICAFKITENDVRKIFPSHLFEIKKNERCLYNSPNAPGWYKPDEVKNCRGFSIHDRSRHCVLNVLLSDDHASSDTKALVYIEQFYRN